MKLTLTLEQVKQAVADFVNASPLVDHSVVEVKPEHITIDTVRSGQYEDYNVELSGVSINLDVARKQTDEVKPKRK